VDFLEKPFSDEDLVNAIEAAYERELGRLSKAADMSRHETMMATLSPRERQVMEHIVHGLHAKEIGEKLGISHRTVEVHKAHIMEKLGARSVVDIVRLGTSMQTQEDVT
jgi:two-component system response regulator FixJ